MQEGRSGSSRIALLDTLRGVAIVIVVLGHVVTGLSAADLLGEAQWAHSLTQVAYSMHMPLFAFMAGLFVARSSDKRGKWAYLRSRTTTFVYLYLFWTVIQGCTEIVTSRLRNGETSIFDLLKIWSPISHLWFLPWLLIGTVVAVIAQLWKPSSWRWIVFGASLVVMVAAWGFDGNSIWNRGLSLYAFFFAGVMLTDSGLLAKLGNVPRHWRAGVGVLSIAGWAWLAWGAHLTVATTNDPGRTPASVGLGITCALLGVLGLVSLFAAIVSPTRRGATALGSIGRASMAIYLGHIIVTAGSRILLVRLGVEDPVILLTVGVFLGVAVPMTIERIPVVGRLLFAGPDQWATVRKQRVEVSVDTASRRG